MRHKIKFGEYNSSKFFERGFIINSIDRILSLSVIIVIAMNILFMCYQNSVSTVKKENAQLQLQIVNLKNQVEQSKARLQRLSEENIRMSINKNAEMSKITVKLEDTQKTLNIYYPIMEHIMKYKHDDSFLSVDFIKKIFFLSETADINPFIVLALIDVESQFDKNYVNGSQIGLMQLSEPTARWIHNGLLGRDSTYEHVLLQNPVLNVSYGLRYLSFLSDKYDGDYNKMLKEYCGGYSEKYEADGYYENVFKPEIISSLKALGQSSEDIRIIFQPFNK